MSKYINLFNNHTDYNNHINSETFNASSPNIAFCKSETNVKDKHLHYGDKEKYRRMYFTTEALENGIITYNKGSVANFTKISYKKNDNNWVDSTDTVSVTVVKGDKIQWKCEINSLNESKFESNCNYEIYGNIMSLLYGDNFVDKTSFPDGSTYTFDELFYNNSKLIYTHNLILPATILVNSCYISMFWNCTSLVTAPELPATTLAGRCYSNMFQGCTSLTKAPELPALELVPYCYFCMFGDCTNLVKAPELPATTLDYECYRFMFQFCTSLVTAPQLPATILATRCYAGMFSNCTSLTKAPELPATALLSECYDYMFHNCTKLNYIKALFIDKPGQNYTSNWVYNVSKYGKFIKSENNPWTINYGYDEIPENWIVLKEENISGIILD